MLNKYIILLCNFLKIIKCIQEVINYDYEIQVLNGIYGQMIKDEVGLSASLAIVSLIEDFKILSSVICVGEINITMESERTCELENIFSVVVYEKIKKILLSMQSALELGNVPIDYLSAISLGFYSNFLEAVEKIKEMSER